MPTPMSVTEVLKDMQVLLLIRQIEATARTATAARVSLLCIGMQAVMDAYLSLLHLTTGPHSASELQGLCCHELHGLKCQEHASLAINQLSEPP